MEQDHPDRHGVFVFCASAAADTLYLTGRGISVASAGTGGLILIESVHIAAEGMSSAAFRRGPFEMIGPETFVLVYKGCGESIALIKKLADDITSADGFAALV